jgi:hypothetical protein
MDADPQVSLGIRVGLTEAIPVRPVRWGLIAQIALVAVVFCAAGFCFYECSRIAESEVTFEKTMGGKHLPPVTDWVLRYRSLFFMLAAFIPCAAVATFALRERWQAVGALAGLILLAAFHATVVHLALWAPTFEIRTTVGGAAPFTSP